jgi:FkbM family methyltransferase
LTNKTFITAFVADKAGQQQKFYTLGAGAAGSMFASHARSASFAWSYYMVDTTTIDEIVKQTGIVPGLVKIDVEGAESMALQGATELAKQQKTMFMVGPMKCLCLPMRLW